MKYIVSMRKKKCFISCSQSRIEEGLCDCFNIKQIEYFKLEKIPESIKSDIISVVPTLNNLNIIDFINLLYEYFCESKLYYGAIDDNKFGLFKEEILFLNNNNKIRMHIFDLLLYLNMINSENKPIRVTREDLKYKP